MFGGIVALVGKVKAEEFFLCLTKILGLHIAIDSILEFATKIVKKTLIQISHGLITLYHIYELGECIKELGASE